MVTYLLLVRYYPLYTGDAFFVIQAGVREAGEVGSGEPLRDDDVYRKAKTELVLLVDRSVLLKAADDPDLQKSDWFKKFEAPDGSILRDEAVDELEDDLSASVVRGTELFTVSWSTREKEDVPKVLNAVARAYLGRVTTEEEGVFNDNLQSFRQQLSSSNRDIENLDQEIKDFIITHDIQSMSDSRYHQSAYALADLTSQLQMVNTQTSLAGSNLMQTQAKLEGTMEYSPEDVLEAEMDYGVVNHIRMIETLKVELRVLREQYQEDHQMVRKAESRLAATETEKKAKIEEVIKRNLDAKVKAFASEIDSMQRAAGQIEMEVDQQSEVLRKLAADQSVFQSMQTRREFLETSRDAHMQIIKEIQMMKFRADASRVRPTGNVQTPRELSFPLPEIIIPLGVLVVMAFTIGIIFIREITDQRVKSAADLAIIPGANVLGVIPDLEEDPTKCGAAELVIRKFPNSILAESYRQACTPIVKGMDHAGHQTMVLLGGLPGAGTSVAVSNLAAGLAAAGRRTLVVDANFRRPRLAEIMGVTGERAGLGDLLAGEGTFEAAVVETEYGVSVLPAGSPANRVIERLNTEKMDSLVAEMRGKFDMIVFDAPPAVVAGDALVLANKLDSAVLVVRASQEHRGLVARLINQLNDTKCELLGILLNRPRGTAGGYFKKNFATMAAYASKAS